MYQIGGVLDRSRELQAGKLVVFVLTLLALLRLFQFFFFETPEPNCYFECMWFL